MSIHKDLTGADLHEPKGADTATSGKVYVSDGAGSGAWTEASSVITNTAFTTGDLKPTHKTTADTSWILWSDGTIGDGSSSASIRANADTADLFGLYWGYYSSTVCPVYTSAGAASTRGASAVADYAAHKRIGLPPGAGRALGLAGSGSGLTTRTVGETTGSETHTLTASQIPSITSSGSNSISVSSVEGSIPSSTTSVGTVEGNSGSRYGVLGSASGTVAPVIGTITSTGTNSISVTSTNTGGTSHTIMQPTAFVNVMIKL